MQNFFENNTQADNWNNPLQLLKLNVLNIKFCWLVKRFSLRKIFIGLFILDIYLPLRSWPNVAIKIIFDFGNPGDVCLAGQQQGFVAREILHFSELLTI